MKRFKSILCIIEPEKRSEAAVIQSVRIASEHQADLTFASVFGADQSWRGIPFFKKKLAEDLNEITQKKRSEIESWLSKFMASREISVEIYSGIGFIEIIKSAINNHHDLVIKCAEDNDWINRLLGSEDMHLIRKCPCPVLMLKPGQIDNFRNILATVDVNDDSSESEQGCVQDKLNMEVLEYSAALCLPELIELHVGSVWEPYAEDFFRYGAFTSLSEDKVDSYVEQIRRECADKLDALLRDFGNRLGEGAAQYLLPRRHLVKGAPAREIPLIADKYDIDLIVMGTVGRTGIPGLFIGNTAESILEQAKCSVLAIKPEGFKTPVE